MTTVPRFGAATLNFRNPQATTQMKILSILTNDPCIQALPDEVILSYSPSHHHHSAGMTAPSSFTIQGANIPTTVIERWDFFEGDKHFASRAARAALTLYNRKLPEDQQLPTPAVDKPKNGLMKVIAFFK